MEETERQWRTQARLHFETLLDGIDSDFEAWNEKQKRLATTVALNQVAETLNQALRRLRQVESIEQAAALAFEVTRPFSSRCAVFLFRESKAHAVAARGLGELPIRFSPDQGAAFQAAIASGDPVIAIGTDSEISPDLAARVGSDAAERVYLFPLRVRSEVKALLFAAGAVEASAMELIAGLAAMQMEALSPRVPSRPADLLDIQGATPPKATPASWTDLAPELQTLHLRAQREARFRVAELRLEHGDALRQGLERADVYSSLQAPIDAARARFRKDYLSASPTMVDYLSLELIRGLVHGDEGLLGLAFPGPQV